MSKRRSPITSETANSEINHATGIILAEDRAIVRRKGGKISEEQYRYALERIACGDTMRNVTVSLGVSRSALLVKAYDDPEFRKLLAIAQQIGTHSRLENAEDALRKGDMSTGDVRRDIAIMDYAKWCATKLNPTEFGDKVQVDQRTITINMKPDEMDW